MRRIVRQPRKRCPQCGERKSRDLFNKNRAQADGLQTWCRKCENGCDERTCPQCATVLHGQQRLCDQHQAEYAARQAEAQERGSRRREEAAARTAADELARSSRQCVECSGPIPASKPTHARYCGDECRDMVNKRRLQESHAAARKIVVRSCEDCGSDISERATQHPLATRCEPCQAKHRTGRKRPRRKVQRSCTSCGASIVGRAKTKTICMGCEPKPPRLCTGCGQVDLRGTARWRCEECQEAWDAGESERARQWQEAHPEATMLIRARARAKSRGIECTITAADIVIPDRCPVLGIELQRNLGTAAPSPNSPSIDRIDNDQGYVPGNVHVISAQANSVKVDYTVDELADGAAGEHWQKWAVAYLARKTGRRAVRRRAAA